MRAPSAIQISGEANKSSEDDEIISDQLREKLYANSTDAAIAARKELVHRNVFVRAGSRVKLCASAPQRPRKPITNEERETAEPSVDQIRKSKRIKQIVENVDPEPVEDLVI